MRVLIVANPIAGAGRAREGAARLRAELAADGHVVDLLDTRQGGEDDRIAAALAGRELLVVVGGDGAVRMCAAAAMGAGCAVYHVPYGTENLFARQWGMSRDPQRLRAAVAAGRRRAIDVGFANGQLFLLMASMGIDAEVVDDLTARRRGAISHRTYAIPIVRQALRWRGPRLTVEIDGDRVVDDRPGMVVVGNSRQYGWRIDPALRADMSDGALDMVFFPARTSAGLVPWLLRCRLHRHLGRRGLVYQRGRRVVVTAPQPVRFQLDGDRPQPDELVRRLEVDVVPEALRVLLP